MKGFFKRHRKKFVKIVGLLFVVCILTFLFDTRVYASSSSAAADASATVGTSPVEIDINGLPTNVSGKGLAATLQILLLLTVIALAPSILIMVTSFTRIIVVLHFVRTALATQTTPPNQVLVGLALFLTFFIMSSVFAKVNTEAIQPLSKGEITQEEALEKGLEPIRTFMYKQTRDKDVKLFLNIANIKDVKSIDDIPTSVLIPSFIISELRKAFIMGFLIYIPFIVIDMVVASTLMSMGMMMLPPTTISMPFKILLFVLADGWNLIIGELVKTFMVT